MRTKRKIDVRKIGEALRWARASNASLDESDYLGGYLALQSLFESKLDLTKPLDARAGAYAVYGWMPTILKTWEEPNIPPLLAFVRIWKSSIKRKEALTALRENRTVLQAINSSTVGTRKFLHFVAPDVFPIWDSRIALVFNVSSRVNDPDTYLEYCEVVHQYLANGAIDWGDNLRRLWTKSSDKTSDIRKLEFCLFAHGKHKGQLIQNERKLRKLARQP